MNILYLFIYIVLFIYICEFIIFNPYRIYRRKSEYAKALQKSRELNRKLVVIGSPYAGYVNSIYPSYGCGDICIDLKGCGSCKNQVKGDLLDVLKTMPSNRFVIFESCVMEYINNKKEALFHMNRVSGNHYYPVRIGPTLLPSSYFHLDFIKHGFK